MGGPNVSGRRTASWLRPLMAAVAVGALVAACGGDGDGGAETSSSSTVTPPAAPPSAPPAAPPTSPPAAPDTQSTASPSPTSTPAAVAGLLLEPDGLGIVDFGGEYEAVIEALTAEIGAPRWEPVTYQDGGMTSRSLADWDGLSLTFTGPVDGPLTLWSYEFGRAEAVADDGTPIAGVPWEPTGWQLATATADGIAPGTPAATAAETRPNVYVPDCGRPLQQASLLHGAGEPGQTLFFEPMESGLYVRVTPTGTILAVGAQASPNELACDGA